MTAEPDGNLTVRTLSSAAWLGAEGAGMIYRSWSYAGRARRATRGCLRSATPYCLASYLARRDRYGAISEAKMSGTGFGTVVLHVAPEAAIAGGLALVRSGDCARRTRAHANTPDQRR